MVSHLRRFVTSPIPTFENEFISETQIPVPLYSAAKCLALCIKVCRTHPVFHFLTLLVGAWRRPSHVKHVLPIKPHRCDEQGDARCSQ